MDRLRVLIEARRRWGAPVRAKSTAAQIRESLFAKQLAFDSDPDRRKAAFCTRRAGKTDLVPKHMLARALEEPESIRVYLAVTRVRAKELIWRPLQVVNEKHGIGAKFNETLATVTLPNHAVLRLRGADDKRESEKGRGDKLAEVTIDEAQIFPSEVLQNMVDDVYGPTLEDVGGQMNVLGTPGIVCAGKWFNMTQPDIAHREPGWSVHSWSVLDNPFMAHMKKRLPELKAERGWSDDNPTYRREWLGQWVNDTSALFYSGFDSARNVHDRAESELIGGDWAHVLGWDIGLRDDMALVVWAFHPGERDVYEAFSWKQNGVTSEAVIGEVRKLESRGYNFLAKVADTGGLGALVVEEVAQRFRVGFEAAQKSEKGAHVELFNDDLLTGRAKVRRGSPYALELAQLPKDPESPPTKWPVEDPRFPNHCCDAGLYAWRRALHWLHAPTEAKPPRRGTAEWHQQWRAQQEAEMDAALEVGMRRKRLEREEREEFENMGWPVDSGWPGDA